MPVKKVGKKFEVNKKTYDTEDQAKQAYMTYIAKAMGVEESSEGDDSKESDKDSQKKKSKK